MMKSPSNAGASANYATVRTFIAALGSAYALRSEALAGYRLRWLLNRAEPMSGGVSGTPVALFIPLRKGQWSATVLIRENSSGLWEWEFSASVANGVRREFGSSLLNLWQYLLAEVPPSVASEFGSIAGEWWDYAPSTN